MASVKISPQWLMMIINAGIFHAYRLKRTNSTNSFIYRLNSHAYYRYLMLTCTPKLDD